MLVLVKQENKNRKWGNGCMNNSFFVMEWWCDLVTTAYIALGESIQKEYLFCLDRKFGNEV